MSFVNLTVADSGGYNGSSIALYLSANWNGFFDDNDGNKNWTENNIIIVVSFDIELKKMYDILYII